MPFGYYYIDIYYIILVVPALLISLICQIRVKSTFRKYSQTPVRRAMDGASAAERVLRYNNVYGVRVERVAGELTDHFDPRTNVICLSDGVYSAPTVAAVGVAAHEAGHAAQYSSGYFPIKIRSAIIPITQIGSSLAIPLVILGLIFSFPALWTAGILCFSLSVVFQLVTLPVEFNASRRAMETLRSSGMLDEEELRGARKVLTAAALTYVAALAVSLAQLLRLIAMTSGRDRRR